jgi:hypothetical protein
MKQRSEHRTVLLCLCVLYIVKPKYKTVVYFIDAASEGNVH